MNSENKANYTFHIEGLPLAVGGVGEFVAGLASSQIFKQRIVDAHDKEFYLAQPSRREGVDYNWEMQKVQNDLFRADIGSFLSVAIMLVGITMLLKSGAIQRRKKV